MRLAEEKSLIFVEVVLLIAVIVSDVLYDYSQGKNAEYMNSILISSIEVNNWQNQRMDYMMQTHDIKFDILNQIKSTKKLGAATDYADDEIYNIRRSFFNGSSSLSEADKKEYDYLITKSDGATRKYNEVLQKRKTLLENPPTCWKYACEEASAKIRDTRFILLVLALGLYIWIFKTISKRDKDQVSKKQ